MTKQSILCFFSAILFFGYQGNGAETVFKAGAAKRDITPKEPVPMWGYGERLPEQVICCGQRDPEER